MKYTFAADPQCELPEPEAIRRAQQGDAAAFEYLYKKHCKQVYGICLRMLRNTFDAEDMTQQIFLRVFRKIGTFRGDSSFSTWLHRVTVNTVLMHLRRKEPTEAFKSDSDESGKGDDTRHGASPSSTSMLGTLDRRNLLCAIRKLPVDYKRSFLLHDVMGYQHHEVAGLVRCSIACSKSRVHRARKRMRHLLHLASLN